MRGWIIGPLLGVALCGLAACDDGDDEGAQPADAARADSAVTGDAGPGPDGAPPPDAGPPSDAAPTPDAGPSPDGGPVGCVRLADDRCVEETFANPPVLQPNAEGVYELELRPTEFEFAGQRHCARAYNGMYPAPTIDTPAMQPGQPRQVRVNLRNAFTRNDFKSLDGEACECRDLDTGSSCEPEGHGEGHTCHCVNAQGEACHMFDFNLTNLHAHGSHVRPDYAAGGGCVEADGLRCRSCSGDRDAGPKDCFFADDVISRVGPGEGVQHRWDIDEDGMHHEGLHWYHPHIHGSTAIHVASGATGAWIVRGPLDALPGIRDAKERVMVITTPPLVYEPLAEGDPCDEDHITFDSFPPLGSSVANQTNLLNGLRRPRLIMPPGQIERWRILHGSFLDEMTVAVFRGLDSDCENLDFAAPVVPLTQIGRDGLALPRPPADEDWPFAPPYMFLSPGYRIEALLDGRAFEHGDTLCVMSARHLNDDGSGITDQPVGFEEAPTVDGLIQLIGNGDLLAIVNVTDDAGPPTGTQMPDLAAVAERAPSMMLQGGTLDALQRCEEVKAITDVDAIDQLSVMWAIPVNQDGFDACGCPDHNLNCKNFELTDRERYPYDRVLEKGSVDHWRLLAGFDGHPFHIHINPFLVCPLPPADSGHPNAKGRLFEPPFAHWRDTYLVNLDRQADLLTEYRAFTGDFVYHCHKLNHEDHGMMELINVCDPATEDCGTKCSGGACGWKDCAPGDDACERALSATRCVVDRDLCADTLMRCTRCSDEGECPPASYCGDERDPDGVFRCVPGCREDADCAPLDACRDGACEPAPCAPPCPPGQMCRHGACQ